MNRDNLYQDRAMTKRCEKCGSEFAPAAATQKFCSRACYNKSKYARWRLRAIPQRHCRNCGGDVAKSKLYCGSCRAARESARLAKTYANRRSNAAWVEENKMRAKEWRAKKRADAVGQLGETRDK